MRHVTESVKTPKLGSSPEERMRRKADQYLSLCESEEGHSVVVSAIARKTEQ